MQAEIVTQAPPADSNKITRATRMTVVVLLGGVVTILVGMLVGILEAA